MVLVEMIVAEVNNDPSLSPQRFLHFQRGWLGKHQDIRLQVVQ